MVSLLNQLFTFPSRRPVAVLSQRLPRVFFVYAVVGIESPRPPQPNRLLERTKRGTIHSALVCSLEFLLRDRYVCDYCSLRRAPL